MANKKGNRANVMDRWYGREKDGYHHQKPRAPFVGVPQYTFDQLYITPFTHAFTADDKGRTGYTPIERNLTPTGILHTADLLLLYTDMTGEEITRRSGAGICTNLYFIYERDLNTSSTTRRNALHKPGECGRYKIVEQK